MKKNIFVCQTVSRVESWARKGALGKNQGNTNRVRTLVNNSVLILVHQLQQMHQTITRY